MILHRVVLIAIMSMASSAGVAAQPDKSGGPGPPRPLPHHVDDLDRPTLSARVLDRALAPYVDGVRTCYLTRVRPGRAVGSLRLELVIERDGSVRRLAAVAPGVSASERRGLEACVRRLSTAWHFPVRGGATSAVIPFYFLRTRAPGAGAQPGCWSPRGCPDRGDKERP